MQIFGHRGAPGFPRKGENTIASFQRALEDGADGIELDVRRCGNGRIVVIHDETIDRTAGTSGVVAMMTDEELSRFDVPLLETVLKTFAAQTTVNVELKEAGLANEVLSMILQQGVSERVIVSAFDWKELGGLAPQVSVGLLADRNKIRQIGVPQYLEAARSLGANALHIARDAAPQELIEAAHGNGFAVRVYTVNEPPEVREFRKLGADAIFTDFPQRSRQVLSTEVV